ncbi:2-methoxy-6-polyprenyl-1,4-benzoquinol methylase, mitochondrial [Actinosynnema sp. ALI-1.44]
MTSSAVVDVSADMVALATAAAGEWSSRVTVADAANLPHEDDSVDVAVSTLSMHEWPDPGRAVGELARVLRPGGVLLVYDFRFSRVGRAAFPGFVGVRRSAVRPRRWPAALFTRVSASAP